MLGAAGASIRRLSSLLRSSPCRPGLLLITDDGETGPKRGMCAAGIFADLMDKADMGVA